MGPAMGVVAPEGSAPRPPAVPGAGVCGVNDPSRGTRQQLAGLGYAAAVPGHHHGHGPAGTGNDDDLTEAIGHIGRPGFTCGARGLAGGRRAAGHAGYRPSADCCPGCCAGGTPAWLAACLRGDLAAAVLCPPGQPLFAELSPAGPCTLSACACSAPFLYGGRDRTYASGRLAGMRARISYRGVNAQARVYPGAGHSLTRPRRPMRHAEANRAAWDDAISFLCGHMGA